MLFLSLQYVAWWVSVPGLVCGLCSQREEMPMCAFIPIAVQSLSLSLHVKCTGILKRIQYRCLVKDSLTHFNSGRAKAKCTLAMSVIFVCNCCFFASGRQIELLLGFQFPLVHSRKCLQSLWMKVRYNIKAQKTICESFLKLCFRPLNFQMLRPSTDGKA